MQQGQFYPKGNLGDTVFLASASKKRIICITVY